MKESESERLFREDGKHPIDIFLRSIDAHTLCLLIALQKSSEAYIIDDLFDLLDVVLDTIEPSAKIVVLEVEQLESSMEVLDKVRQDERSGKISLSDRGDCEARELVGERRESDEVVFGG